MSKLSVIVPVYNAEKTLHRCVDSILAQTFRDIELILVNDGSTDGSGKICDEYAAVDRRVKVIHKKNGGVSSARNAGLNVAEGEGITFMDADDTIPERYLEILLDSFVQNNADITVCDVVCLCNGEETRRFSCRKSFFTGKKALEMLLSRQEIISGPYAKLLRRSVIGETRFPPMRAYEDMMFNLAVFSKAARVSAVSDTEYRYIDNPAGAMAKESRMPSEDIIAASEQISVYLKEHSSDFSGEPFYATASHLMSYVLNVSGMPDSEAKKSFLRRSVALFKENRAQIRRNKCFPFKEKLQYLAVSFGYLYGEGRIRKL